ncbi:hypothetical protein EAH73_11895 [Hymenobacter nivis]|uniref:Uncharacterized protein n=2 Tax=Hymenobacter nivis TaxID=1850093 RepID=A0A502GX15_9BACT|nr:hypothetical protein EAH73_11895 [Hymenobacter nivis]
MSYQRVAVLLVGAAAVGRYAWGGPWLLLAEVIPTALLFPMVHDEAYNFTRLWIDWKGAPGTTPTKLLSDGEAFAAARKEYRYGYQSPTTTARNDFNGQERTWLAIAGAVLLLALYLLPILHR